MKALLVTWLLVLVGCPGSGSSPSRPPDPNETPPTTADPGAVQDRPELPPTPPPEQPASGGAGTGSGSAVMGQADGAPCLASVECTSGVCEGEGCGPAQPGKCAARSRACTRDLRAYCGCDGKTFRASGSCPGQRFSAKGECP